MSLATRAANAAGGIRFNAELNKGGSSFPFNKKKGSTLHARMVIPHEMSIIQNSSQDMVTRPSVPLRGFLSKRTPMRRSLRTQLR